MSETTGKHGEKPSEWRAQKSTKQLKSSSQVKALQKEWFFKTQERVKNGEPFAICNADECEEIFLTMDIPVLVKQWWSGLISAKQLSPRYFNILESKGYDLCTYCALPYGCTLSHDPETAPWGGLPRPSLIIGTTDCDAGQRVTELWAREYNTALFPLEVTSPTKPYIGWWEKIKDHWDEVIEPHRLDMRVAEYKALIHYLEVTTGKKFSMEKLRELMELINEQEGYFRMARDLIAKTTPCPVNLTDQTSTVMPLQWHRGKPEGRDGAKMFYEEVKERVENHQAACPNEKIRMMWLGVGLWSNTAFYQYFEEKYGAVFVCSMYLSIAADGYQRNLKDDPLRALASRNVFLGLNTNDWFVKEAKLHNIAGAVQLVSTTCRIGMYTSLTKLAFEKAGIPVLEITADNVDARKWDDEKIKAQVSEFIEKRCL
ncbi:MAG: 2-hydroxyacyl-CoA dehydratase [Dehalococcoidales bacterium]|nr:2-hydroxyacyl-CoA dehydratase [Dehalococcoidales bacterium]